jgi:uroporphyrinogen decarboxylase
VKKGEIYLRGLERALELGCSNTEIRENYLRALEFRNPEWIPCSIGFSPATWKTFREKLEDIVVRYPLIFGSYERGSKNFDEMPVVHRKGEYYTDNWGCVWYNIQEGLEGQVVGHPLEDWKTLETYQSPDPLTKTERDEREKDYWEKVKRDIEERREKGLLTVGGGERLFDRLYFLRGLRNLMIDIVTDDPHLPRLIGMLLDHEMKIVKKWLEIGVDMISFHTDIGTQNGLMISPAKFRKHIKPMFKEIFTTCRDAGVHVYLSSDGHLLDIVDDLIECGVSVHDPQLRANTLEGIAKAYKGKMCINLDLDRQMFPFCKPSDIRRQIKEGVEKLYLPEGGLMIAGSFWGGNIPLENIEAMCQAMEEFCFEK